MINLLLKIFFGNFPKKNLEKKLSKKFSSEEYEKSMSQKVRKFSL